MKYLKIILLMSIFALMQDAVPVCAQDVPMRKYYDAYIIGIFHGNPSMVGRTMIDKEQKIVSAFQFNSDGSMVRYYGGKVENVVRNDKNQIVRFSVDDEIFRVDWDNGTTPLAILQRGALTKKYSDDYVKTYFKTDLDNGRLYVRSEDVYVNYEDEKSKRIGTMWYKNRSFDAYGNIIDALITSDLLPETDFSQTISYHPDKSIILENQRSVVETAFKDLLFHPAGYTYDSSDNRNMYQKFYAGYVDKNLIYRHEEHRSKYDWPGKHDMAGFPYTSFVYSTVGGDYETVDVHVEFTGTRHELTMLRDFLMEYMESNGFQVIDASREDPSMQGRLVVGQTKKKEFVLTFIHFSKLMTTGISNASFYLTLSYHESKK